MKDEIEEFMKLNEANTINSLRFSCALRLFSLEILSEISALRPRPEPLQIETCEYVSTCECFGL